MCSICYCIIAYYADITDYYRVIIVSLSHNYKLIVMIIWVICANCEHILHNICVVVIYRLHCIIYMPIRTNILDRCTDIDTTRFTCTYIIGYICYRCINGS